MRLSHFLLLGGLRPALSLNFLNEATPGGLTLAGGANATRINSAGTIVAASPIRFDYNPVSLACKGALIEAASTNMLLNSLIDGTSLGTQSVTTTNVAHTLSFYGTGTVTLSGTSTAGPLVGSAVYPTRSTLTFTPTAGSLTLTVSGSVQFAQLEIGSNATSFTPTAGAAVTRTADLASVALALPSLTSGALFVEWTPGAMIDAVPCELGDGTGNNTIGFDQTATGFGRMFVNSGGATQSLIGTSGLSANTTAKMAASWAPDNFVLSKNGGTVSTDTAGTVPTVTTLYVGSRNNSTLRLGGHVRRIDLWTRPLPASTLQRLTAS